MRYLGLDVHSAATVWCLLDAAGKKLGQGKVPTTGPSLFELVMRHSSEEHELLVGQEVGTMSYFVYDVLSQTNAKLLSFNAQQLRMIASSRKKTDKRDAYWIAKALQTDMMPHPVYIPSGEVRLLRQLLSQREGLLREQKRWLLRAKASVRAAGIQTPRSNKVSTLLMKLLSQSDGLNTELVETLCLYQRMHDTLSQELGKLEAKIRRVAGGIEAIKRLQTIPGVGPWVATTIYATVGDVSRFPDARRLASVGLVPRVWQSGESEQHGGITKQGTVMLRSIRMQANRKRRKIAVVAAARHILRIAYYVLRDGTNYDPTRLASVKQEAVEE
jgi:transposase